MIAEFGDVLGVLGQQEAFGRPAAGPGVCSAWHDRLVSWPPQLGELLPRAEDAYGVHEKLAGYSLNRQHADGGHKAVLFDASPRYHGRGC